MSTLLKSSVHAGLSGITLEEEAFELGQGVVLSRTYAHLMAPFLMAFNPASPGGAHPAPWKAASGGFGFDVTAELLIPHTSADSHEERIGIARTILFLLRLGVNPATTLPVFSSHPFRSLPDAPDNETTLLPYEVQRRHFPLGVSGGKLTEAAASWVKQRWPVTHELSSKNADFSLAVDAIDSGQFVQNHALTMVSLWGALEALFSPATTELKFRVSALIASFLEAPGNDRAALQRKIAKLYDKRSAAAHGKPKHQAEDLLESFNLLRAVLMKIIDIGQVPSKESLEAALFGATGES